MSTLNSIVNVSISRNTTRPSQTGFGTPIIMSADPFLNPVAGTEWGAERVRAYSSLSGVEDDFADTTNVYKKASKLFAQNPAPPQVKIGKLSTSLSVQTVTFQVDASPAANASVGFQINDIDCYATAVGDATATATLVAAAADLVTGVGATSSTDTVTVTATTAGQRFRFGGPRVGALKDTTATAAGLATDLGLAVDTDNDFYCILLDGSSATEIEIVSEYVQDNAGTNPKIFVYDTFDDEVKSEPYGTDAVSIMYDLKAATRTRSLGFYTETGGEVAAGMAGRALPELAGSLNWGNQTLLSVTADTPFTTTEFNNIYGKNGNTYTPIAGINMTRTGMTAGNEWIDVMRGSDWLVARIQEDLIALLANSDKVPFTDAGIATVQSIILSNLQKGVGRGFLAANPAPTVDVPLAVDVPDADKQARHLRGVVFRATLAGAVNNTTIVGELDL